MFRFRMFCFMLVFIISMPWAQSVSAARRLITSTDPVTRYIHIEYPVPADCPDEIRVVCSWSLPDQNQWQKAKVFPLLSETAWFMLAPEQWSAWRQNGAVTERNAAGLIRTIIFDPYPEAQIDGIVNVDFKITLKDTAGSCLAVYQTRIRADNSDVVYIEDWTKCFQTNSIVSGRTAEPNERKWSFQTNLDRATATFGHRLFGQSLPDIPLVDLTYPLDLKGPYAIYVNAPGGVHIRLTGDDSDMSMSNPFPGKEKLWKWAKMDHQHFVIHQNCDYTGCRPTSIDYVKLVPLTDQQVTQLEAPYKGRRDKIVIDYWEPYSWAFHHGINQPLDHLKPLLAYKDAGVDIVEFQIGRFGMKAVYESRIMEQLIYETWGDPIGSVDHPATNNVGAMQQYTNTLDATLRYCRMLDLTASASFGASNCYKGKPLQGRFSKDHPEWMRGSRLRYEVPEVRQFALDCYRECLEIGARHLGLDFCRYPTTIDVPETANIFLRDLRRLADDWGQKHNTKIPILVRFPVMQYKDGPLFDYATWARNDWVDIIVPSKLGDRFYTFDVTGYIAAVRGTDCKVMPCVGYDLRAIGLALHRARDLYRMGAHGVYFYQGWAPASPDVVRNLPLFGSTQAIERWWQNDAKKRSRYSKGIYIFPTKMVRHKLWRQNRVRVWLDGIEWGEVEIYLDDELVNTYDHPPYTMGVEGHEWDERLTKAPHTIRIKARDGKDRWLEQSFILPESPSGGD